MWYKTIDPIEGEDVKIATGYPFDDNWTRGSFREGKYYDYNDQEVEAQAWTDIDE